MNFNEAIEKLDAYKIRRKNEIKLGLDRIKKMLDLLDNPQEKLKVIHVAGTNGKGSVCTMLSYALCGNHLKTGLFISPHIINVRERLQIDNKAIPEEKFAQIFEKIHKLNETLEHKLTFFEAITAMGFEYFLAENCDVVVIETGLGGRLDATNVVTKPICSIITSISLDHTKILGDTIEKITFEKCGIIKNNVPVVVSSNQENSVKNIISETCKNKGSKVTFCKEKNISRINLKNLKYTEFFYENNRFELSLKGAHQLINANTALETLKILKNHFNLSYENIFAGLKKSYIPGRFEVFKTHTNNTLILDGAHNPAGIKTLANSLENYFKNKNLIAICGILKNKDVESCLKLILSKFQKVYTVMPTTKRAMKIEEFNEIAKRFNENIIGCENPEHALNRAITENPGSIIITFGSLYLIGDFHNQCINEKFVKNLQ